MPLNKILSATSKAIGTVEKSKPMQWAERKFNIDPEKALGLATVTSIVIKDGVGCYKYVTQSIKNDKIPEEKRKFVAALDLTNGILMITAQIAMYFAMRKYSGPLFEKIFKSSFNPETAKNIAAQIRMKQAKAGEAVASKLEIEKAYNKVKSDGLDLFKFVADIAAATIIGKRVIVPFIATPLAAKVKNKMEAYSKTHNSGDKAKSAGEKPLANNKQEVELNPQETVMEPKTDSKPEVAEANGAGEVGKKLDITTADTNLLKRYYDNHQEISAN